MFARDKHSTAIECHLRLLEDVCGRILQSNVSFHRFVLFLEALSHFIPYGAVQSGGKVFFFFKKKIKCFFLCKNFNRRGVEKRILRIIHLFVSIQ